MTSAESSPFEHRVCVCKVDPDPPSNLCWFGCANARSLQTRTASVEVVVVLHPAVKETNSTFMLKAPAGWVVCWWC